MSGDALPFSYTICLLYIHISKAYSCMSNLYVINMFCFSKK